LAGIKATDVAFQTAAILDTSFIENKTVAFIITLLSISSVTCV